MKVLIMLKMVVTLFGCLTTLQICKISFTSITKLYIKTNIENLKSAHLICLKHI